MEGIFSGCDSKNCPLRTDANRSTIIFRPCTILILMKIARAIDGAGMWLGLIMIARDRCEVLQWTRLFPKF